MPDPTWEKAGRQGRGSEGLQIWWEESNLLNNKKTIVRGQIKTKKYKEKEKNINDRKGYASVEEYCR